jgi:phosphoglycerate dehydrogenase-like enzyme
VDEVGVMIASPLPAPLAETVAQVDPRVRLLYDADVLPAQRWPGDVSGDPTFRRDADAERRWRELLARADVLYGIPGNTGRGLVDALRAAPRARWVQARNAGAGEQVREALALDAAALRDVQVTSVSGIHARALAEFALLGILAFAKNLPALTAAKGRRAWADAKPTVRVLSDQTVVVVGLGAIGLEVARLAGALGMRVLGVKRTPGPVAGVAEVAPPEGLAGLAVQADALVVTLPLTEASRGLVDAAVLAALPSRAVVVNVGRGAVIDEPALIAALRERRLAGAALDVFAEEPLPVASPLWELDNVIVSPHVAARVEDEDAQAVGVLAGNLRRRLDGAPLRNRVDPEQGY